MSVVIQFTARRRDAKTGERYRWTHLVADDEAEAKLAELRALFRRTVRIDVRRVKPRRKREVLPHLNKRSPLHTWLERA